MKLLRDVEENDDDASKPVARSTAYGSLRQFSKTLEQNFVSVIGTLSPHGINERFSFLFF